MNEEKKYTAADIERYHKGLMTSKEMHLLEKAALEDAFLADALEGYAHTDDATADMNDLKQKLDKRLTRKGRVNSMERPSYNWLKAAAVFVIVAGAAFFTYNTLREKNLSTQLSKKENKVLLKQTDSIYRTVADDTNNTAGFFQTDSLKTSANYATVTDKYAALPAEAGRHKDSAGQFLTFKQPDSVNALADLAKDKKAVVTEDKTLPAAVNNQNWYNNQSPAIKAGPATNTANYNFAGRVTDKTGSPVSNSTVSFNLNNRKQSAITDSSGFFRFNATDSVVNVNIAAAGYAQKNSDLKSSYATNSVVLDESRANLSEVTVSGVSAKRKKEQYVSPFAKEREKDQLQKPTLADSIKNRVEEYKAEDFLNKQVMPAGGWDKFYNYIQSNKRLVAADTLDGNEVVLTFTVMPDGKIRRIKTETPLAPAYDAEATRLLKEGPQWKSLNGKRSRVRILVKF